MAVVPTALQSRPEPHRNGLLKLKAYLSAISARTIIELEKAIGDICPMFTPEECSNYFKAAGHVSN
jgi:hypothetical protein